MRIIVYAGKGGVGKTSIATATAVRAAELGHRTLVLSTDLAHSPADSLDLPLGPEPTEVAPLPWAQEPDVHHNMQTHWGTIQEWLKLPWPGAAVWMGWSPKRCRSSPGWRSCPTERGSQHLNGLLAQAPPPDPEENER